MLLTGLVVGTTDVNPRRFVKLESSRKVIQAAADTDNIIGISPEGAREVPMGTTNNTWAADGGTDTSLHIYGPGSICLLDIGGTITCATSCYVTSDADGEGVQAAIDGTDAVGALIFEDAASGDIKPVLVYLLPKND